MNKVMSRQPHPRHRPPNRQDPRRPGATPPRTPLRPRPQATTPEPYRAPRRGAAGQVVTPPRPHATAAPTATAAPRTAPTHHPLPPVTPQPRPTDLFADRLVAVLSGQRPVHWMLRHTAGQAYDDLARLAERNPLRTPGVRPVVSDLGYFVPRDGALEVFARVAAGDRLRALAFRLERGRDLRWRCTAVELAGSRPPREETG
ncbi:Rv3235 family protein [Streptomyces sp. NPDC048242]